MVVSSPLLYSYLADKMDFRLNRFLFLLISKGSCIHICYCSLIFYLFNIFLQFDWKNYSYYFHFSKAGRSSKKIEVKDQMAICLLSHLTFCSFLHFSKLFCVHWIEMSSGKQPQKYRCHFHFGSAEIHILDQQSSWSQIVFFFFIDLVVFKSKEPFIYWT